VAEPRPYPQLQRTPGLAPWRPLVSLLLGALVIVVVIVQVGVVVSALVAVSGGDAEQAEDALSTGPLGFTVTNLLLALAIPVSMMAIAVAFFRPPGWLASVQGRTRWGWLGICVLISAGYAVLISGVWILLGGAPGTGGEHAALLIGLCLLTTPFQAAGEEYLIRGWLTQTIAAWFARPRVGAVVAGLLSATVFALLHGQQSPWLFADRWVFGAIASYLVWRTGGLEAAIALHALTNVAAIVPAALEGTLDDALTVVEVPAGEVLIDIASLLVAAAVLLLAARWRKVPRTGAPEAAPVAQAAVSAG
jgi:membrane protease YdiL (CAAX protease family)